MTQEEIYKLLDKIYPTAFNCFYSKPPSIPYIVYTVQSEEHRGSDHSNNITEQSYRIELYTLKKDLEAEKKLNKVLNFTEFSKETIYIESEKLYMTVYEFEIISKI